MNDLSDFSATPTSPKGPQQLGPAQIHCTGIPDWEGQLGGIPVPAPLVENEISFPFCCSLSRWTSVSKGRGGWVQSFTFLSTLRTTPSVRRWHLKENSPNN